MFTEPVICVACLALAPEVDQTGVSDLSSVQDADHLSEVSSHYYSQRSGQASFTGSIPSISVTDKSVSSQCLVAGSKPIFSTCQAYLSPLFIQNIP